MSNGNDKAIYVYKRFRVRRADGGSTTVSVDPTLVIRACRILGSLSTVSRVVREAASTYNEAESPARNRSEHAARTLEAVLNDKTSGKHGPTERTPMLATM